MHTCVYLYVHKYLYICTYVYVCVYIQHIYIYTYILPPLRDHILYEFTTKTHSSVLFFGSRCETSPHTPRFCMTPPASKVLVQVMFPLLPLLSVLVTVFSIRIVVSIYPIFTSTITITVIVPAMISTRITMVIAK